MGTAHDTAPVEAPPTAPAEVRGSVREVAPLWRFLPAAAGFAFVLAALLASHTPIGDIARYLGYLVWGVILPGTLVFRALRRTPHTLIEDLALGAATGLALELAAWAVLMALGVQSAAIVWPLAVVIPFAAVPRLRRHWRPRGYTSPSLGWSWSVAGTVAATTAYLYATYLRLNPILPTGEQSKQFVDLPYQMSLAGNAKHSFPLTLPQVSGEPLYYHWFAFVHEAMTSLVGHLDLPVVQLRLMIPALCALAMLVIAVVGWRLSSRPWVGPVAALLIFVVGEFNASYPAALPFGSPQTTLMVWASVSMTYSQPLLLALIGVIGEGLRERRADDSVPAMGRGVYVLVGLFAFASSAAKATSLPVTLAGLALAGLAVLIAKRRIPWAVVAMGAIIGAAQFFSTAVIFRFMTYGIKADPLVNISSYWADPHHHRSAVAQAFVVAAVWTAFLLNTQLRVIGAIPLIWRGRFELSAVQWFLLGGAVAGPGAYLALNGWNSSYFTHAGLAFGALLSAWGYCDAFERAALPTRAKVALGAVTVAFVGALTVGIYRYSKNWLDFVVRHLHFTKADRGIPWIAWLLPLLSLAAALAAVAVVCAVVWRAVGRFLPALRGRGGIVLLTLSLAAGAPTLLLDVPKPQGAAVWGSWSLPTSKVDAARWIRAHSDPSDVLATNEHCWLYTTDTTPQQCNNDQAFTLSAYSERSVLVEGWGFAPRAMDAGSAAFWDKQLLWANDDAVYHPTAELLTRLHDRYHVRYLVVNRRVAPESPELRNLAKPVYDNTYMAVYELR